MTKKLLFSLSLILSNLAFAQENTKLPKPGSAKPIVIPQDNEFNKIIIEGWNAISPAYLDHKLHQVHPGDLIEAPVFKELIEKYAKNAENVLDAATGNGWFTTSLLKWNVLLQLKRIVGVDISPVMIVTAQSQCSDSRAEFFCSPLESDIYQSIGISNQSLDLIISSNAVDCIKNVEQVISRLNTLLKPSAYAIISIRHPQRNAFYVTADINGEYEEGAYAEKWAGTGGCEVIRFFYKEATWNQLFIQGNFKIVEKRIPVISEAVARTHPEHYKYYKNKKHPGALIYVLRKNKTDYV